MANVSQQYCSACRNYHALDQFGTRAKGQPYKTCRNCRQRLQTARTRTPLGDVDPNVLADKYSVEAVRYYLMSDIATGKDADYSEERLVKRYNVDLANNIGNLVNRTLNMAAKYRSEKMRATTARLNDESKQTLPGQPIQVTDNTGQVVTLPAGSREFPECS